MTPSSKAKVLTDAELLPLTAYYAQYPECEAARLLATIDALKAERDERITPEQFNKHQDSVYELIAERDAVKAELALKDKVVEAARCIKHWHCAMADDSGMVVSKEKVFALWDTLNDLDKVAAR